MSVFQSSSSHSNLPFELEREVFQIAALALPKSLPTILLVARRFRTWKVHNQFEPELYRVIRSGDGRVVPPLYTDSIPRDDEPRARDAGALDIERLQRFGPWVHHILLQCRLVEEIAQILNACPNVHNLALWIVRGDGAPLVPVLARLPLRRLSFDPRSLFYYPSAGAPDGVVPLGQKPFNALTHLQVINACGAWGLWHELALLPRLTHLALEGNPIVVERALAECAALEVLVQRYAYDDDDPYVAEQKDPRIVLLCDVEECLDEWEVGAGGGEDFWVTAEKRVKNARLGGRTGTDIDIRCSR